ncbi:radical SAM protein [Paenibacillus sp. NPDC058071]|uniref:SPL family radical SAM protein n=1 Tax=Paenibacillus sp. NPDC058071 TaxID=3346326 RepID=UPI0036DE7A20
MQPTYEDKIPKSLLNKGTGSLVAYTHTLNPYAGCVYGCSYCYVRQMPVSLFRGMPWGSWVDIKREAAELLRKELLKARRKGKVTIFMSSSTDPYQPIEYKEGVTRSLLEAMLDEPPDFLLVQTRSPLVTRDIDLLQAMGDRVRVSMTVETDLESIRKRFSPSAPPIPARIRALAALKEAGVPAQATIAPLLPSSEAFPAILASVADRICIDDYFMGDGAGGRRTAKLGIADIYKELGMEEWYGRDAYRFLLERMKTIFREEQIRIGQAGFAP